MRINNSLFSQLLAIVNRNDFEILAQKHKSNKHSKGFRSWDQFVSMLFCQLAQAKSLREITSGLKSCEGKLKHLGMSESPSRSTLSYANAKRPWEVYQDLFYKLLERCRKKTPGHKFRFKNRLLSLDATIVDLCASMFDWAKYRTTKGAVKLHLLLDHDGYMPLFAHITAGKCGDATIAKQLKLPKGSIVAMDRAYIDYAMFERWTKEGVYFVTRMKSNTSYCPIEKIPVSEKVMNIIEDEKIVLNPINLEGDRKCKEKLRRVEVYIEEKNETIELITNILHLSASTIAAIYKERWQIEIFFKTIKQNLRIKTFVGTTANAVHIQIWTALIAILLLRYLQLCSRIGWAMSNLVALLRWNLFTYRDLWKWIDQPFDTPQKTDFYGQQFLDLDST
jgi:hypothetical protein